MTLCPSFSEKNIAMPDDVTKRTILRLLTELSYLPQLFFFKYLILGKILISAVAESVVISKYVFNKHDKKRTVVKYLCEHLWVFCRFIIAAIGLHHWI